MSTDRELLELAAKAAGVLYNPDMSKPHPLSGVWWGLWLRYHREPNEFDRRYWNPLTCDGDALRLAVSLWLEIDVSHTGVAVRTPRGHRVVVLASEEPHALAATRLAIVRAAAELGKAIPPSLHAVR